MFYSSSELLERSVSYKNDQLYFLCNTILIRCVSSSILSYFFLFLRVFLSTRPINPGPPFSSEPLEVDDDHFQCICFGKKPFLRTKFYLSRSHLNFFVEGLLNTPCFFFLFFFFAIFCLSLIGIFF